MKIIAYLLVMFVSGIVLGVSADRHRAVHPTAIIGVVSCFEYDGALKVDSHGQVELVSRDQLSATDAQKQAEALAKAGGQAGVLHVCDAPPSQPQQ